MHLQPMRQRRLQRHTPSKKIQFTVLLVIMAVTTTIYGCRGDKPAEPAKPSATLGAPTAPVTGVRTRQQAMDALMALPELKAWSSQIEASSGGALHGALIAYDPQPKLIKGRRYFQLSFVENGGDAARRWESFLVPESGDDILVDDGATDRTLTLTEWRAAKQPMRHTSGAH